MQPAGGTMDVDRSHQLNSASIFTTKMKKAPLKTSSDLNSAAAPIPSPRATAPLMGMRSGPAFNEYDF